MNKTTIEWVRNADGTPGYTWNVVSGCDPISAGCDNCYASRIANRFKGTKAFPDGFKVTMHPERLNEVSKLEKPSRIFVCSMSDLFHSDVPDTFIDEVFGVMKANSQHTFFVLTKRPERMLSENWATWLDGEFNRWYAPNIWVGVSAENQEAADKRIPVLLDLLVAHRFVSCEPLIGPVDLTDLPCNCSPRTNESNPWNYMNSLNGCGFDPNGDVGKANQFNRLDWVIVGGETGPGARKMEDDWAFSLCDQCYDFKVPFFFKKWGGFDGKDGNNGIIYGGLEHNWPEGV